MPTMGRPEKLDGSVVLPMGRRGYPPCQHRLPPIVEPGEGRGNPQFEPMTRAQGDRIIAGLKEIERWLALMALPVGR